MMRTRSLLYLLAWCFPLLLAGCGQQNSLDRVQIVGTVTLDGKPIDAGMIQFDPTSGTVGSGASIVDGHYAIATAKGLPPGAYQVRIFAPRQPAGAAPAPPPGTPPGPGQFVPGVERVAVRFNAQTQLTAEVPGDVREVRLNFEVTSN